MKRLAAIFRSNDAQALAEWAVVFPVQLFITLGVVQLALVLVARDVVSYAAHSAARAEVVGADSQKAAAMICSAITWTTHGMRDYPVDPGFGLTVKAERLPKTLSFPAWLGPQPSGDTGTPRPEDDIALPGWGKLENSNLALLKTHTFTTAKRSDHADFVEVQVLYEYELIIPAVNWAFSTHRINGHPHLGIVRTARVPKPWVDDERGAIPHPEIKVILEANQ